MSSIPPSATSDALPQGPGAQQDASPLKSAVTRALVGDYLRARDALEAHIEHGNLPMPLRKVELTDPDTGASHAFVLEGEPPQMPWLVENALGLKRIVVGGLNAWAEAVRDLNKESQAALWNDLVARAGKHVADQMYVVDEIYFSTPSVANEVLHTAHSRVPDAGGITQARSKAGLAHLTKAKPHHFRRGCHTIYTPARRAEIVERLRRKFADTVTK